MRTTATNTEDLVRGLLGRVAFEAPAGAPRGCCFKTLEDGRGPRAAAGTRRECPECGQLLKAVLLGARRGGRDDVLARGPGGAAAIAKEADPGYRIAGVFVSKGLVSPSDLEAALSRAGFSVGAPAETEFGWWAGAAPDGALLVEAARGVWIVLQEVMVG
jgi:hypothetical protein